MIPGWAHSPRHVSSQPTGAKRDHAILHALGPWAPRRHPPKPCRGRKEQYVTIVGGDHWGVQGIGAGKEGTPQPVSLLQASSVPSKRHTHSKGAANPDEPAWAEYCERRSDVQMEATLQGRRP